MSAQAKKQHRGAAEITMAAADAPAPLPKYVLPSFAGVPAELAALPNWVLWVPVWIGSKYSKRPIQTSGYGASTKNPRHWTSFDKVAEVYEQAVARGYIEYHQRDAPPRRMPVGGIGFVFDGREDENGLVYAGVDFDKVLSGSEITSLAQERIKRLGSYVERSVSGTGLHVIVKANPLKRGITHDGVEMYTSGRYFTMTLRPLGGSTIKVAPVQFAALAAELESQAEHPAPNPNGPVFALSAPQGFSAEAHVATQNAFAGLQDFGSLSDGLSADLDEIRDAVAQIPPSAIASEGEWVRFARGVAHHASIYKKQAGELYEILDGASLNAPSYDEAENRKRWDRYVSEAHDHENPITIATVFHLAKDHGWLGYVPPSSSAPATTSTPMQAGSLSGAVSITSLSRIPKKREWVCGTYAMRGAISMFSAPGARGKTSWLITFAMSCASGALLLGAHVFGGPKRVLYWSAEERTDEINLRLRAAMQHHGLSEADLSELYVTGADRGGLQLMSVNGRVPSLNEQGWGALEAELDRIRPDILIIDPLIMCLGGADVNDNAAAGLLMGRFARLAALRNMAVIIAHHVSKARDPRSADGSMGAVSYMNLSRIGYTIDPLDEADANKVGLPPWEAKFVFRIIGTKQNYSPVKSEDDWFRLVSVEVQNAQPPIYPNGDSVGVVERFTPAASGAALYPPALLRSALQAIQDADPPLTPSARSKERYAGPAIAKAIATHRGGKYSEAEAKAVMGHLLDTGLVRVEERKIGREGGRSDLRKGLFPTAGGTDLIRNGDVDTTPHSPQTPASSSTGAAVDAGGDLPCASPATQGGYGGKCGGEAAGPEPVSHDVQKAAPKLKTGRRSGPHPEREAPNPPLVNGTGAHPVTDVTSPHPASDTAGLKPEPGITLSVGEPDGIS